MEHTNAAQVAAVLGAIGVVLVLVPRGRALPLLGFGLLGGATAGLGWWLVGDDDLRRIFGEPAGIALLALGAVAALLGAFALVRYPAFAPVALLLAAPFRVPVEVGDEDAFLLLPLYLVLASTVLALAYRTLRGDRLPAPPWLLALPIAAFAGFLALSFLWTWDEREGAIELAFFVFPFVAGFAVVARSPLAAWLPRALLATLVGLGAVFAAIGLWQAQTRTLFFAPSLEVANAYTSFFRVTALFKDPSLYGRYLVVPIVVLLVVLLLRRNGRVEWIAVAGLIAFLFAGLYFSYSQSSFVALFATTVAVAFLAGDRRTRIVLIACAAAATLAAGALAAQSIDGRSAQDVTSGRSRLVSITIDAFQMRPVAGVGIGGQPQASAEAAGRPSSRRNASHTTPLTVLAELGVIGFALYAWLLGAAAWGLYLVAKRDRALGIGLAAVLLVVTVHSFLYAGFFEDPLVWGVLGLTAATLAAGPPPRAGHSGAAGTLNVRRATGAQLMPRALKWIIVAVAALVLALAGAAIGLWLANDTPSGALDTELEDVTVTPAKPVLPPPPKPEPKPELVSDRRCWLEFGGNPRRSLARPDAQLGLPRAKPMWLRSLGDYIEFPGVYCDGTFYVNTVAGSTYAIEAETGKVRWRRQVGGTLPSSPAIDGPRLFVASQAGTVTALDRARGRVLWRVQTGGKVESSPVVVNGLVYFGSHDGRLFAVYARTGRIRWAYQTAGRINASPSVFGGQACVDDVCRLHPLRERAHRPRALDDVRPPRRLPLRELLREPLVGREEDLLGRALGQGRGARRAERCHRLDRAGRRPRLHDAGRRERACLRGWLRRPAAGVLGHRRGRAVEQLGRRQDPRGAGRHRPPRLRDDEAEPDVGGAGHQWLDRVEAAARALLAGDRDRADLLLHAQRAPDRLPREKRPAGDAQRVRCRLEAEETRAGRGHGSSGSVTITSALSAWRPTTTTTRYSPGSCGARSLSTPVRPIPAWPAKSHR